jgi:hypothetical protein
MQKIIFEKNDKILKKEFNFKKIRILRDFAEFSFFHSCVRVGSAQFFTRVSKYVEWIDKVIKSYEELLFLADNDKHLTFY